MQRSDAALVQACRRGDETAWEELVNRFRRLVFAIPRRSGLDAEQSADVFQRVFMLLVERLDDIQQPERISAWLVTTAKHETWRVGRRQATVQARDAVVRDDASGPGEVADESLLPDQMLVQIEEQSLVQIAVDQLDPRCRQLMDLLFYRRDPAPYSDIAAQLGIAEGSIGPIRARCLQRLRRDLEARGFR
jgi:RNA polymerase sigma factor (sigma-70 family)